MEVAGKALWYNPAMVRTRSTLRPDTPVGSDQHGNLLTIEKAICAYIRQGAFPQAAAQSAGLTPELFATWMERGLRKDGRSKRWRDFRRAVEKANADARVTAEMAVHAEDPRTWLRSGPGGRDREGTPGWAGLVKPISQSPAKVDHLATPEWNMLWAEMLKVLAAFPEARLALADALAALDPAEKKRKTLRAADK